MLQFQVTNNNKYLRLEYYDQDKELKELRMYFKLRNSKYYFDPNYKKGLWDGYDAFYNDGYISIGLWYELLNFMKYTGIKCQIDGLKKLINNSINYEKIEKYCNKLFEDDINVRHYQIDAVTNALKYKFCAEECSTGSGKTLITFLIFKILFDANQINKHNKFLIVVPRVDLVNQTAEKFDQYNKSQYLEYVNKFNILKIGGKNKFSENKWQDSEIVITTNKSLSNFDEEYLKSVNCLIVDEAHSALSPSVNENIKKCSNVNYRIGLSGTLDINYDDGKGNRFSDLFLIEQRIGPLIFKYKTSEQVEEGFAPNIVVNRIQFQYPEDNEFVANYLEFKKHGKTQFPNKEQFSINLFNLEKRFVYSSVERAKGVADLINSFQHNTLVLFQDIKNGFGELLYNQIVERTKFNIYYIDGNVDTQTRNSIVNQVENDPNSCLVATYGTFSTGIDIARIYNILLGESYKSQVLIKQTIGRGVRAYANQQEVHIWDIIDGFCKYSKKHGNQRLQIYQDEGYTINNIRKIDLTNYFNSQSRT